MSHFVLPCGSSILFLSLPTPKPQGQRPDPQPVRRVEKVAGPQNSAAKTGGAGEAKATPEAAIPSTKQDATPKSAAPGGTEACMQTLPLILGMFALMYFLIIRPQQKQEKQRRAMLGALKKGDEIVTSGGMYGSIESLDERTVTVRVGLGEGMKIKFDRASISRVGAAVDEKAPEPDGRSKT